MSIFAQHMLSLNHSPLPLSQDLARSLMRRAFYYTPLSVINNLIDRNATKALTSPRYRHLTAQLYKPITLPSFTGYWLCRGLSTIPILPRDCDVAIFYLHGGGYVAGHPADSFVSLLYIAEAITKRGKSISIFSLDYTLATKSCFPKQVEEAMGAYEHLVNDEGIDPSKIVVLGESAGGHLLLSFLTNLYLNLVEDGAAVPPPRGRKPPRPRTAVILSAWIDLRMSHPRARELEKTDFLGKDALDMYSKLLLRTTPPNIAQLYDNFGKKMMDRGSWKDILPEKTWISAGEHEILIEDVKAFVDGVKQDEGKIELEIMIGETHAWQTKYAFADQVKFLATNMAANTDGLMKSFDGVVDAILVGLEH